MPELRVLIEGLLDDDSFPRAGAVLAANPSLLAPEADDVMAALLAQARQRGDGDREIMIGQFRAFARRCLHDGLAAVFWPDHPVIDPAVVSIVSADMRAADNAEREYDRTGDTGALTAAAAAWRTVMSQPSLRSAYPALRAALLNNAGGVLLRRYWADGQDDDLDGALEALHVAVALTPPRSPLACGRLANLGLARREVYRGTGDHAALDQAADALERAVQVAATATALVSLALVLQDRYLHDNDPDDLARAIDCAERACRADDEPGAPQVMLGDLLRLRYQSAGQPADLARAVTLLRAGLRAAPPGDPERPLRLVDLGIALWDQHFASADPRDLDAALLLFDEAARLVPAASPNRPGCLAHRAIACYSRYQATGSLDDLDRAVDGLDEAVRTAGAGSVDGAAWTVNLAAALHERARRADAGPDLSRAVALLEAVCDRGTASFYRHAAMNDLGNALRDRYHAVGSRPDLDRAALILQAALDAAPPGSPVAATLAANLGAARRDQYADGRSAADLDAAVRCLAAAVEMSSPADADRPRRLFGLALATRDSYELSHRAADLTAAVGAYRAGCEAGLPADPLSTLAAAQEWGAWATERRSWPEAAAAFGAALAATLAVVQAQVVREHKENWLRDAAGLPGRAAYASARAGQLPAAVAGAEAGRAAILAETLRRGDLDLRRLAGDRPDLADRYARAASRLRVAQERRPARAGALG